MEDDKKTNKENNDNKFEDLSQEDFRALIEKSTFKAPNSGDLITGTVITASKNEVKLDIGGIITGVVRGPELYEEDDDYANLKPGDEVEATMIDNENENGELELSFRFAGQEKAWAGLREAEEKRSIIKVKIVDANKGGLLVKYRQIAGFLPVSQLAPENYPRVNGGDKSKILERLKSYIGKEFDAKLMTLNEKEDKIIFSEKEAWNEKQKDTISKYKIGTVVKGTITAITDFGVFVSFGENLEGLIHISELAWQRIDNPNDSHKVGDVIKAEVISLDNSKIFLSAKKLMKDPWENVNKKYQTGQVVQGQILKVNPFGLFVSLDEDIHGLAHISQVGLEPKERIIDKFRAGDKANFEIVTIEPKDHRLGLAYTEKELIKEKVKKEESSSDDDKAKADKKSAEKKLKKDKKEKDDKDKSKDDKDKKEEKETKKIKDKTESKKTKRKKKE